MSDAEGPPSGSAQRCVQRCGKRDVEEARKNQLWDADLKRISLCRTNPSGSPTTARPRLMRTPSARSTSRRRCRRSFVSTGGRVNMMCDTKQGHYVPMMRLGLRRREGIGASARRVKLIEHGTPEVDRRRCIRVQATKKRQGEDVSRARRLRDLARPCPSTEVAPKGFLPPHLSHLDPRRFSKSLPQLLQHPHTR